VPGHRHRIGPVLSATFLGVVLIGAAQPSTASETSAAVTLYDQTDNAATGGSNSQNFDTGSDQYDNQVADDFVVPAGGSWIVDRIEAPGEYLSGPGPADSVNVFFYQNAGTLPGAEVASRIAVIPADGLATGDFGVNFSPITLTPGHYWISVQANLAIAEGQWFWTERTVQSNHPAAYQEPGDGSGNGCTTWGARATTCMWGTEVDQVFRIIGSIQTPPPPSPSFTGTANKSKEGKSITFQVGLSAASTEPFQVPFATQNGSAKAGQDYKATAGILSFAPGDTSESVTVKTKNDPKDEKKTEKFSVQLTTPAGPVTATGKIKDNDR
jgi:Calx-beta domain